MKLELEGKFAVITGGSKGIGYAVAQGLAKEGVDIALISRGEERLQKAVDSISSQFKVKVIGITADVTKENDIKKSVDKIRTYTDRVDILINNAGTGSNETIMNAPDEKWQYFWDLFVMSTIRYARLLLPLMEKSKEGVILNTSSICASQPLDYEPIYNTTKAALVMLSKCLANEFVGKNIRVNTINPGLILTEDWLSTASELTKGKEMSSEEYLQKIAKDSAPIGRFATPEELANLYVFLCSSRASYCLGSTYYADGGMLKTII